MVLYIKVDIVSLLFHTVNCNFWSVFHDLKWQISRINHSFPTFIEPSKQFYLFRMPSPVTPLHAHSHNFLLPLKSCSHLSK